MDNALMKNSWLNGEWSVAYSANDLKYVRPLMVSVRNKIGNNNKVSYGDLKKYFAEAYAEVTKVEFLDKPLRRYGFQSVEEFRQQGQQELGDKFFEFCRELDNSELAATSFIVYGYDENKHSHLFEVSSSGETDRKMLSYAVIGSGYSMATASLRRKPLTYEFKSTIYRLLEAKFSAETASGVGEATTVIIKRRELMDYAMGQSDIKKVREIWAEKMKESDPSDAIALIEETRRRMESG
jgi:hypothetical protein